MCDTNWFMKTPCKACPFRNDIKPYISSQRVEELAYATSNPYNTFPCHKTFEYTGEQDEYGRDEVISNDSKECAGFLMMQINEGKKEPEGFNPNWELSFESPIEMIEYYEYYNEDHVN